MQTLEAKSGPQVLTLENLSYGFNVWLIACGISIMGFVYEWIQVIF
jgi:hypothetical protein